MEIRPGVAAVILDSNGRLLLHHRRVGARWAPPSGTVEAGESLVEALHREVHEETQLAVTVRRLAGVYSDPAIQVVTYPDGRRIHFVTALFTCDVTGGRLRGSDEGHRWAWFPVDALPAEMLEYGRVWVRDALSSDCAVVVR